MNNPAKQIFEQGGYTCVLSDGETTYTSTLTGISPLVGFLSSGTYLKGFFAADKIVGKAAALLFALAQVRCVYAPVMSRDAAEVFSRFGIQYEYGCLTPGIINRTGDGPCPMEQAVTGIDNPEKAFEAVKQTLKRLRSGNQQKEEIV